ncbi:MAG: transglycosylase domain-containing protein, partial [Cyclobacteriaceae bacterium]|nr:transglycosylase domain-containing protein [Cyclobacteriaceae bacterium]
MKISLSRKRAIWAVVIVCLIVVYHFSLPATLFSDSYSTVVQDRDGQLLSAAIAPDGQWRFPESDSVPLKYSTAVVALEDKRFWQHPGVDLLALARAIRQNVSSGRVVSGGSTLTMQVVRLSRKNPPRNIFQKFIEVVLATRLEIRYTKKELLNLYASHAPFGGNVVGIEAACWRYFGR